MVSPPPTQIRGYLLGCRTQQEILLQGVNESYLDGFYTRPGEVELTTITLAWVFKLFSYRSWFGATDQNKTWQPQHQWWTESLLLKSYSGWTTVEHVSMMPSDFRAILGLV